VHFGVEARQVEAVRDVFFVDLAEVFIAARRYKLWVGRRWLAFWWRFIREIDGGESDVDVATPDPRSWNF
jgi:hypothetical protein